MKKSKSRFVGAGLFVVAALRAFTLSQAAVVDVALTVEAITPDTVVIAPGDTVRWTVGTGGHRLHSDTDSFKSWDSGVLGTPGQTFDLPFAHADGPGPFLYHCLFDGHTGAVLVSDTCFATGTLAESGPPSIADLVMALRIIAGQAPPPDNLYRLDLTGDCVVDYADAGALSDWFQFGPGVFPVYPVPTCCFPELRPPACPVVMTGDVEESGSLSASDIIFVIHFVFLAGPTPRPCAAAGDVNCSGSVNSADVIYLVNYIFKSGPIPCDVCELVPALWTCP